MSARTHACTHAHTQTLTHAYMHVHMQMHTDKERGFYPQCASLVREGTHSPPVCICMWTSMHACVGAWVRGCVLVPNRKGKLPLPQKNHRLQAQAAVQLPVPYRKSVSLNSETARHNACPVQPQASLTAPLLNLHQIPTAQPNHIEQPLIHHNLMASYIPESIQ